MDFTLKIWRQKNAKARGRFETYNVTGVSPDCSFLEMLDILNQQLIDKIEIPICFDHDCREGICGACSLYINGRPHGPDSAITACQLHMRKFRDQQTIIVEPWRAKPFPVIKDLIVDRSAFDKIIAAGGFISVQTGGAPEANSIPVRKEDAENAMDAAACIGCGACVATCKNASAMLFVAARVSHFSRLPQGQMEARERVLKMVDMMDKLGFGNCTNTGACEAECPKQISISHIAKLNREYLSARII
jgi:succinate dehydrogenase / fumarate reductase, iron-sulfur subunit